MCLRVLVCVFVACLRGYEFVDLRDCVLTFLSVSASGYVPVWLPDCVCLCVSVRGYSCVCMCVCLVMCLCVLCAVCGGVVV